MSMRKTLTIAALLVVAGTAPLFANETDAAAEVKRIAQTLGEQTVAAIKLEEPAERRRMLRAAAEPAIDFRAIAQGVLNYAGAKVPDAREAEVVDHVVTFMTYTLLTELERIRPETAKVGDATVKDDSIRVSMSLDGAQDSIDGVWHFKKFGDTWKVTDIGVTGGTLTGHFGEKLSRHARGIDQLVDYLQSQQQRMKQTALRTR